MGLITEEYQLLYDFLKSNLSIKKFGEIFFKGNNFYSKGSMLSQLKGQILSFLFFNKYISIINYIGLNPKKHSISILQIKKYRKELTRAVEDYSVIVFAKDKLLREMKEKIIEHIDRW